MGQERAKERARKASRVSGVKCRVEGSSATKAWFFRETRSRTDGGRDEVMARPRSRGAGRTGPVGGSCAGTGEPMPARPAVVMLKPRAALACVRPGRRVEGSVPRGHRPKARSYEQTGWRGFSTTATMATGPGTSRPRRTYLCQRRGRDLFQHAGGACAAKHESHRARVCSSVHAGADSTEDERADRDGKTDERKPPHR